MSNSNGRVTRRHIGRTVDFRNELTNVPGVTLLGFERRGQFDLALIRLPSGKEMFVERDELHLTENT